MLIPKIKIDPMSTRAFAYITQTLKLNKNVTQDWVRRLFNGNRPSGTANNSYRIKPIHLNMFHIIKTASQSAVNVYLNRSVFHVEPEKNPQPKSVGLNWS